MTTIPYNRQAFKLGLRIWFWSLILSCCLLIVYMSRSGWFDYHQSFPDLLEEILVTFLFIGVFIAFFTFIPVILGILIIQKIIEWNADGPAKMLSMILQVVFVVFATAVLSFLGFFRALSDILSFEFGIPAIVYLLTTIFFSWKQFIRPETKIQ